MKSGPGTRQPPLLLAVQSSLSFGWVISLDMAAGGNLRGAQLVTGIPSVLVFLPRRFCWTSGYFFVHSANLVETCNVLDTRLGPWGLDAFQ